jgi:hypothetical protein
MWNLRDRRLQRAPKPGSRIFSWWPEMARMASAGSNLHWTAALSPAAGLISTMSGCLSTAGGFSRRRR